jgi:DNA modification methylase
MKDDKPAAPVKAGVQAANAIDANCAYSEMMSVADLKHHPQNPNQHSEGQLRLIQKVLAHQGWRSPLIVSNLSGFVVCGNGRLMAARAMGLDEVPVDRQDFASEADEIAHLLADNKIASLAELDNDLLKEVLLELDTGAIDMDLTGFESSELEDLMTQFHVDEENDAEPKIDQAAELQKKWGTKLGQVWELGDHRIVCGDSTAPETLAKLMGEEKAEMVFTDPPYDYGGKMTGGGCFKKETNQLAENIAEMSSFNPSDFLESLPAWFEGRMSAFIFCNKALVPDYLNFAKAKKYNFNILTWHKTQFIPLGSKHHYPDTEYCIFINKRAIANAGLSADHYRKYWITGKDNIKEHPTAKPVLIIKLQIEFCSNRGGIVGDPFLGSGSTLIACENLGRKCRAIEIAPEYVAVAIERWHEVTGKSPELLDG